MTCRHCNDKNKIVKIITWAVYLAPLAYSAYVVLKDTGAFEKAQPYVDTAKEKVQEAYEMTKETVSEVIKSENPVEALKSALLDARNAAVSEIKNVTDDTKDGNA